MACVHNASWVYQRRQNVRTAKIYPDGQDLRVRRRRHVSESRSHQITDVSSLLEGLAKNFKRELNPKCSVLSGALLRAHAAAGSREDPKDYYYYVPLGMRISNCVLGI
jgi:hypothetical protein